MKFINTKIDGAYIIEPTVYEDERGSFCERFNMGVFNESLGIAARFVQMNQSVSNENVLRGLHYQYIYPQAKLVWVNNGIILDVFVDLRENSPTFGQWDSYQFDVLNRKNLLYIPQGLAHGFLVKSREASFNYLVDDFRFPEYERTLMWNDPDLNIDWGITNPIISEKDRNGLSFKECIK